MNRNEIEPTLADPASRAHFVGGTFRAPAGETSLPTTDPSNWTDAGDVRRGDRGRGRRCGARRAAGLRRGVVANDGARAPRPDEPARRCARAAHRAARLARNARRRQADRRVEGDHARPAVHARLLCGRPADAVGADAVGRRARRAQLHAARAAGRLRAYRAVELPADACAPQDRAGDRGRQHRRAQALRAHAALGGGAGAGGRRDGAAAWRHQHRLWRRTDWHAARRASAGREGVVHRRQRDRAQDRPGGLARNQARDAGAWRQDAARRVRRCRPGSGGRGRTHRQHPEHRAGVRGMHAPHRPRANRGCVRGSVGNVALRPSGSGFPSTRIPRWGRS